MSVLPVSTPHSFSGVVLGLDACKTRSKEVIMSEIEELRKEIVALRDELEKWQAIVVSQEGKIGRALGVAEGAAETQGLLNKSFDARIWSLEMRTHIQSVPVVQPLKADPKDITWRIPDAQSSVSGSK